MAETATRAILLRRIAHGDYDLIVTLLTLERGKTAAIAKAAKKSVKRFSGALELFTEIEGVLRFGRGMPVIQEATIRRPFEGIRGSVLRAAYASYWAELVNSWMEEGARNEAIYRLLAGALGELNAGRHPEAGLSILFQVRFMEEAGLGPELHQCCRCRRPLDAMAGSRLLFDAGLGGISCEGCGGGLRHPMTVSKGTLKQLCWVGARDLQRALRVRFPPRALEEANTLLESFVPFQLGKEPRSLKFLRQIRG